MLTKSRKIVLPTSARPIPIFGVGIVAGNPTRCLICRKKIQAGDRWLKYLSPSEPELPTYSIIVHWECERRAR